MKKFTSILIGIALIIAGCSASPKQQLAKCKMLASEKVPYPEIAKSDYVKNCMVSNGYEFLEKESLNKYSSEFLYHDGMQQQCDDKYLGGSYDKLSQCYQKVWAELYLDSRRWK